MPKYYSLICEKYVFHVSVEQKGTLIKVGSNDWSCVALELDYGNQSIIVLDFFHHAQYAMNVELEKKEGTRIMLKASLTFARNLMKSETTWVEFQDESAFFYPKTRIQIPLADRDIFIYGKTWYQQHIGFRIKPVNKSKKIGLKYVLKVRDQKDFAEIYKLKGNDIYEEDIRPFMFDNKVPSMKGVVWIGKFSKDLVKIEVKKESKGVSAEVCARESGKMKGGGSLNIPRPRMLFEEM